MMKYPMIIPFRVDHYDAIKDVYSEPSLAPMFISQRSIMNNVKRFGPSYTCIDEDGIVGCGGIAMLWERVGQAWAIFSPSIEKHGLFVSKFAKWVIYAKKREYGLDRIQAIVLSSSEKNKRWVEFLGFQYEGTLRKYISGMDFEMVAIT